MSLRLALILTGVVFLLSCVVLGVTVAMFTQPGTRNAEQRVQMLGSSTGMVAALALAGIWIPYAMAWKKQRDGNKKTKPKKKKARRIEDDDDE